MGRCTAHRTAWRGLSDAGALPEPGIAQLLWCALSMYWRQLSSQLPASGQAEIGDLNHLCPVCGHVPTGSLIQGGAQAGLRYLQCSLCECQWHVVRATCTNCDSTGALDYWCLESEKAPIKAESCNGCNTYLKAFTSNWITSLSSLPTIWGALHSMRKWKKRSWHVAE